MSVTGMRGLAAAAVVLVTAACSDNPAEPVPTEFSIAVQGSAVNINKGAISSLTVLLTRKDGFTGDVVLSVEQLPAGVTVPPDTIHANQTIGTLVFTTTAQTPVGEASARVRARGEGTGTHSVPVNVIVRDPAAPK
jgi:hypothetical protein